MIYVLVVFCIFEPMRKKYLLVAALIISSISGVNAQFGFDNAMPMQKISVSDNDEEEEEEEEDKYRGFSFGINLGSYFASKKTANIYNGTCVFGDLGRADGVQCFTIDERLDPNFFTLDYQRIVNEFQATGVEVPFDSYPINMRYTPALMVGMQVKYNWGKYHALVFNINAMRVRTVDVFTLRFIGTGAQLNAQQDVRTFDIIGQEQRFNIGLGYRAGFMINEMSNFYWQFGGSLLGTQFERNQIRIGETTYDLILGAQNPNQAPLTLDNAPTRVGIGGYSALGVEFFIKDMYSFDVSFGLSNDQMGYFEYKERGWNSWLMATFTL
jgi:hypothetical protein